MLDQHREMAIAAFHASPPVSFPLHEGACSYVQARIVLRGGPRANVPEGASGVSMLQLRGSFSQCLYTSGGNNRHIHAVTTAYMRWQPPYTDINMQLYWGRQD